MTHYGVSGKNLTVCLILVKEPRQRRLNKYNNLLKSVDNQIISI